MIDLAQPWCHHRSLLRLPPTCHHSYHDLLKLAALYVLVMCDVKRGKQSIEAMRKSMFRDVHIFLP